MGKYKFQKHVYTTHSVSGYNDSDIEIKTPQKHYYVRVKYNGKLYYCGKNGELVYNLMHAQSLLYKEAIKKVNALKKKNINADIFCSTK